MAKIGLNGFSSLGRSILRVALTKRKDKICSPKLEIINDHSLKSDTIRMLAKYDSMYGKLKFDPRIADNSLLIDNQKIQISYEKDNENIPWDKSGVDYVIETNIGPNKPRGHLRHAKHVLTTSAPKGVPIFILGVNQSDYKPHMDIISVGSPCMNCICPLFKVLQNDYPIKQVVLTCFHPLRSIDMEACGRCIRSRLNLAPFEASTSSEIASVIPSLRGKIVASAVRVPVVCVGAIDLTIFFCNTVDVNEINCKIKESSETYMKGIIYYTEDEIVSSDVVGNAYNCVYDSKAAKCYPPNIVKMFVWYDSLYAYANTLFDMVNYMDSREVDQKKSAKN